MVLQVLGGHLYYQFDYNDSKVHTLLPGYTQKHERRPFLTFQQETYQMLFRIPFSKVTPEQLDETFNRFFFLRMHINLDIYRYRLGLHV